MARLRNVLAVVGAISLVLGIGWGANEAFARLWVRSICDTKAVKSLTADDRMVKATVYNRECGAAAATRSLVYLSHPDVDGLEGDVVLTLLKGDIRDIAWVGNRKLIISFSPSAEIEYAVTKTRGVTIEHQF